MRKVAKDSTAAELVALSDCLQQAISAHQFLTGMGLNFPTPVILQENQSTIQMVSPKSKNLQDKYLVVRQSLVRERINQCDIVIRFSLT